MFNLNAFRICIFVCPDFGKVFQVECGVMAEKDACYNCGKTGHYARDCWSRGGRVISRGGRGGGPSRGRGRGSSRTGTCYYKFYQF